ATGAMPSASAETSTETSADAFCFTIANTSLASPSSRPPCERFAQLAAAPEPDGRSLGSRKDPGGRSEPVLDAREIDVGIDQPSRGPPVERGPRVRSDLDLPVPLRTQIGGDAMRELEDEVRLRRELA